MYAGNGRVRFGRDRFDPRTLFQKYNASGLYIPDFNPVRGTLFQDDEGTTLAQAAGDPIGKVTDSGPSGITISQSTDDSRMILQQVNGRWCARGDGTADNWLTDLTPGAAMTYIIAVEFNAVSDIAIGSNEAAFANRSFLQTHSTGQLAAGVGNHSSSNTAGGADIRDVRGVAVLRFVAGFETTFWKPFPSGISRIVNVAQSGTPTTSVAIRIGATNNNGTAANLLDGDLYAVFVIKAGMLLSDIAGVARSMCQG